MGLIQSRRIKSAISEDGLHNVKKLAFIQYSLRKLQIYKSQMKTEWETLLEQKLQQKNQYIQSKKQQLYTIFNNKVGQLQEKDPDFIDKLQSRCKKSFKQITGRKEATHQIQLQKQNINKRWYNQQRQLFNQVEKQIQKIKEDLKKQIPQTVNLNKLPQKTKEKVLNIYIQDDAYQIQRDQYNRKAIQTLQTKFEFDKILQQKFLNNTSTHNIQQIVQRFKQNLSNNPVYLPGCGFLW